MDRGRNCDWGLSEIGVGIYILYIRISETDVQNQNALDVKFPTTACNRGISGSVRGLGVWLSS